MAAALGVQFLDSAGQSFVPSGATLHKIVRIDVSDINPWVKDSTFTVLCDVAVCALFAPEFLFIPLFQAMYLGVFWAGAVVWLQWEWGVAAVLCGLFLHGWERECVGKLKLRDQTAEKYYELETLQSELTAALLQVERMTVVTERARIAHDIHDNARNTGVGIV